MFKHNCNNFTDSFSNFLLGKGIPAHISSMPQAVLDSPMGRMLLPQLTQGVNSARQNGSAAGLEQSFGSTPLKTNRVHNVSAPGEFSQLLEKAKASSAVVFFTSATCPPCKAVYPLYDQLAEEHGDKTTFIKVDVSIAREIGSQFSVRATPTFVTFVKGEEENRWTGADPAQLRGNVQLLGQMGSPHHIHDTLRLPSFSSQGVKPVLYAKFPPLQKLLAKMGDYGAKPAVKDLAAFIEAREKSVQDAVLPAMANLATCVEEAVTKLSPDVLFALVDLFRCALVDPRISGFFAEEEHHASLLTIVNFVNKNTSCPYALRLVTLQMACNMFSTPLFADVALGTSSVREAITQLISSSFLDDSHSNTRVSASSLLFNVALAHRQSRSKEGKPGLPEADQVELAASVLEAISQEEQSSEALHGMLLSLGHLAYGIELDGELADLLRALAAQDTISAKKAAFPQEKLITELAGELLGKGLRKP